MLRDQRGGHPIEGLEPVATAADLPAIWEAVDAIHVEESVESYILDIVRATRSHPELSLGASPRGSLALYKTAQALAVLRARDYVIPDDVKEMAPLALPHRLVLRPESELRGRTPSGVLADILQQTAVDLGAAS
jgi:MoxR-like ATPase